MIRGWRNDPQWVSYYERKRSEYAARQFERLKIEWELKNQADKLRRAQEEMKGRNYWRSVA